MSKHAQLRTKHPEFIYHGYRATPTLSGITIQFRFSFGETIVFNPRLSIYIPQKYQHNASGQINNFVFHLGLVEMLSYWKAACSPTIRVLCGKLTSKQTAWWRQVLIQGLGEFLYRNGIDSTAADFVSITSHGAPHQTHTVQRAENAYVVPVGGGRDSALTLALARKHGFAHTTLLLNPTPAAEHIARQAGVPRIMIHRTIDPQLLALNAQGYLNGHTPFSAYLAFLSLLCAAMVNHKAVLVSNERSSNEGNLEFGDISINHQYSKTFDFEQRFRTYAQTYLVDGIAYLSFLRPLYSVQIAKIFARYIDTFQHLISCNVGRGKRWCGVCAKCVFVYVSLYPFVQKEKLIQIFGQDIFTLHGTNVMLQKLTGQAAVKPFECVGTREETIVALYLCLKQHPSGQLPKALQYVQEHILASQTDLEERAHKLLHAWDSNHNLSDELQAVLHQALQESENR